MPLICRSLAAAALGLCSAAQAGSLFGHRTSRDALLPAAQAFSLLPAERRADVLHLTWNIAPGYYLYRQRIRIEVLAPSVIGLQAIRLPAGITHHDENFGTVQIYRGVLEADVPLSAPLTSPLRLRLSYQGCADAGVCYPSRTVVQTIKP